MGVDGPLGLFRTEYEPDTMPDRDEDSGQYVGEYPLEAFVGAIRSESGMAGTGEIADSVGCAHDTAYKRLIQMDEKGLVNSKKVGNSLVWILPDDID